MVETDESLEYFLWEVVFCLLAGIIIICFILLSGATPPELEMEWIIFVEAIVLTVYLFFTFGGVLFNKRVV